MYCVLVFFFTADLEQDRLTPKCLLYDGHSYLLLKCPSVIIIITIIGKIIVGKCKLIFYTGTLGQGQGFFICHIIVIQGITRSEMQSNQVRSVDSAKQ